MTADTTRTTDTSAESGQAELPCRTHDPDTFFGETSAEVEYARSLCAGCPARAACFAGALQRAEPWGVWGGELFIDGRVVAHKRGRGRPPRSATAA